MIIKDRMVYIVHDLAGMIIKDRMIYVVHD